MLYLLAEHLGFPHVLNLIRYITFRAGAAALTSLFLGLIIGPRFIGWLRIRQGKGQPIRSDGPQTHLAKVGTPTMGGLMILTSLVVSMLIWMNPATPLVWGCLGVTVCFGATHAFVASRVLSGRHRSQRLDVDQHQEDEK